MPFTTKLLNIKQNLDQHFINLDKKIKDLLHEYIITDEENEDEDEIDTKEAHPLLSRIFEILLLRGIFSILATTIINIITAPFYAAWCVYNLVSLPLRLIDLTLDDVKGYLSSPIKAILTLAFVSIMPAICYFYNWSGPLFKSVYSLISDGVSLPGLVILTGFCARHRNPGRLCKHTSETCRTTSWRGTSRRPLPARGEGGIL